MVVCPRLLTNWLFLMPAAFAVGPANLQQKFRVEADGQLAVSSSSEDNAGERHVDRGGATIMRREEGAAMEHLDPVAHVPSKTGQSLAQSNSSSRDGPLQCGWTVFAPDDHCPPECPLMGEETWNPCHFQCLSQEQCGTLDSKATIADYSQSRCRRCIVAGCDVCAIGSKDRCHKCTFGYYLNEDEGTCYSGGWYVWATLKTVVLLVFLVLALWLVELGCRRPTNLQGVRHGTRFRKRERNHMPHDTPDHLAVIDPEDTEGLVYPLSTNLLVTPCGGVATSLHFGFQAYVLFWAFFLAFMWAYFAQTYGYDLLRVGTLPASTPQQLCSVVRWGAKAQELMMEDKFKFCCVAWVFMFTSSITFAVIQKARFHKLDDDMTTMKDFACYVRGLPKKKGEEDVEGMYKDFLEKETGQKLIGVSVCWDISSRVYDELKEALELESIALETQYAKTKNGGELPQTDEEEIVLPPGALTKVFGKIDKLFGFGGAVDPDAPSEVDVDKVRGILESLSTCDVAFAVFETEAARDAAVAVSQEKHGFIYEETNTIRLEKKNNEPGTVRWDGISYGSRTRNRNTKMVIGAGFITLSLAAWCVCFYMPYAYYVTAFTYANGSEPSFAANMAFTMLVVAGNQAMYFVCDLVTRWADFAFEDEREFWYNVYYLLACVANVIADMVITAVLSYKEMVGLGIHTADGRLLENLDSYQQILESYPMQKTMGRMLFAYCFPGTFLTPFLFEPIILTFGPYYIGRWLTRSHPECKDRQAELAMSHFMPFDLSRYSDLLLNMCLAVLIFFLPGGFIMPMFLSMGLSHIFIYMYDHYRVLRAVPAFCFSRATVDSFGTGWMALPTAITAACCVFKGYHHIWPDLHGWRVACVMLWAFSTSLALHVYIFKRIYKNKPAHVPSEQTYADCAQWHPATFFSMNPVHCLRSKYIWGHEPSQVYYMSGKEHLQVINEEIGAYYVNKRALEPDSLKDAPKGASASKDTSKEDPKAGKEARKAKQGFFSRPGR